MVTESRRVRCPKILTRILVKRTGRLLIVDPITIGIGLAGLLIVNPTTVGIALAGLLIGSIVRGLKITGDRGGNKIKHNK